MIYEYEFGVFVEADNEQEAWEKVRLASEHLDSVDTEGDSTVSGPFVGTDEEHIEGL